MGVFFYNRVSTINQNVQRQITNFEKLKDYNPNNVFIDKVMGNVPFFEREGGNKMYDVITSNGEKNTIVVDSIDRLGRGLIDILKTIKVFTDNNINLKSLKEGFNTLLEDGRENPMSKIVISVMGSIAEMERNRIKERTSEGIQLAKAKGKYKGRKKGTVQSKERLLERHPVIVSKLKKGLTIRDIHKVAGKSPSTILKVKNVLEERGEL